MTKHVAYGMRKEVEKRKVQKSREIIQNSGSQPFLRRDENNFTHHSKLLSIILNNLTSV